MQIRLATTRNVREIYSNDSIVSKCEDDVVFTETYIGTIDLRTDNDEFLVLLIDYEHFNHRRQFEFHKASCNLEGIGTGTEAFVQFTTNMI